MATFISNLVIISAALAAAILVREVFNKNMHIWLISYITRGKHPEHSDPTHIMFSFVDHFEPQWANPDHATEVPWPGNTGMQMAATQSIVFTTPRKNIERNIWTRSRHFVRKDMEKSKFTCTTSMTPKMGYVKSLRALHVRCMKIMVH
mgnify:CR=1 FL=1